MSENPFAAPRPGSEQKTNETGPRRTLEVGEVVVWWEKMRWVYNAILTVVTLVCMLIRPEWFQNPFSIVAVCVFGFIGANLCYSAGTILSAYLAWAGFRNRSSSLVLFFVGTLFAVGLATFTVLRSGFPQ